MPREDWLALVVVCVVSWIVPCNWEFAFPALVVVIAGIAITGLLLFSKGRSADGAEKESHWINLIAWLTSNYTRPVMVLFVAVGLVFLFAALYYLLNGVEAIENLRLPDTACWQQRVVLATRHFGQVHLYFSGVTFSSLGYGDLKPTAECRPLAMLESFLGIVVISTYIALVVKKMK